MSERKVLNKYYPPDFDPSKIPKSKEPRNKTFCIRLMAPCNMRCTTCGEYIYKGRKFNARKEDVDDMNYLGLRIYRFYIKCTACVSEICFRTDPENTDYVLESGATRNFEALKRAEEQAEREEKAYREELENNPMKLLEERTLASKNELELAESLDEVRELNRRTLNVDYDSMIKSVEEKRAADRDAEEQADEEFVRSIFSKNGDVKVKRILEDSSSSSSSEEETHHEKKQKTTRNHQEEGERPKVTDILAAPPKKPDREKPAWEKSIGYLDPRKNGLGILVKKKSAISRDAKSMPPPPASSATLSKGIIVAKAPAPVVPSSSSVVKTARPNNGATGGGLGTNGATGGGLGLLGAYSDSGSGSE